MQISISDPIGATVIFSGLAFLVLALSCRWRTEAGLFPLAVTQELKGFAILAVVLSHVGYFLATDHRFLFPLSIFAGVGVDLFLFLSGFGLAASALRKPLSVSQFYLKRLLKLYTPFWIVIGLFFVIDFLFLDIFYDWSYIARSVVGFFPRADIFQDLNSPLWYLTLIIFYYLLFPIVFSKKYPWLSALAIFLATRLIICWNPAFLSGVIGLYKVHLVAFPLGIIFAYVLSRWPQFDFAFLKGNWRRVAYWVGLAFTIYIAGYTAVHSGVGKTPLLQETLSLVTMAAVTVIFIMKKFESKALFLLGLYSYEVYLLHWPIMSRYDFLFTWLPAWLALMLYLALFTLAGLGLQALLARKRPASR